MKYIMLIFGIVSVLYGILVLQAGSGTSFWMIWEVIGVLSLIWSFLLQKGFFVVHPKIGMILYILAASGVLVLSIFCGMIGKTFAEKGEANLDYLIVLGAQIREDGPSVTLKYRLDTAIEYLDDNPDTICIVSGGKGTNELISEAEGMAKYLIEHGIEKDRILLEDKSKNTVENIRNSKAFLKEPYNGVGVVTNDFHMFRALRIAKAQGLEGVCGIAADSTVLYLPNNVLRECFGIMKDWCFHHI